MTPPASGHLTPGCNFSCPALSPGTPSTHNKSLHSSKLTQLERLMKVIGIISTLVLAFLLGTAPSAYGQQEEKRETEAKPTQQEEKKAQPEKPAQQEEKHANDAKPAQQEEKRAQPEKPAQQEEKRETEAKPTQQEEKGTQPERPAQQEEKHATGAKPVQQEVQHAQQQQTVQQPRGSEQPKRTEQEQHVQTAAWQQHRTQSWQSDHRTWQQRGGYSGYRIPDNRFRESFGPDHEFRILGLPFLVVGGYPRFQYGGYWFSAVDPWPDSWAADWYDTDDVYVVYVDNGYYLYNQRYPTVGIAISISL
jgi:hypothetical protein